MSNWVKISHCYPVSIHQYHMTNPLLSIVLREVSFFTTRGGSWNWIEIPKNEEGRELKRGWLSSPSGWTSFSREDGDERGGTLKYCDSTNQGNI